MAKFESDLLRPMCRRRPGSNGVVYADLGGNIAKRAAHGITDAWKQH